MTQGRQSPVQGLQHCVMHLLCLPLQQNLGAIIRSAYCLGADGIVASSKNCAPLSAVVSKASAGALEVTTMYSSRNLQRTLLDAAARGWAVLGASADNESVPVAQQRVDRPTILVMGKRY